MQSRLTRAPGNLCKGVPACRPCQAVAAARSPAHGLSLATVKELVASNSSELLFDLMKAEVSMARDKLQKHLLREKDDRLRDKDALLTAELKAVQLERELAERTAAWLKERGTLTMRGVLVELADHVARHHRLQNRGDDVKTYQSILDHISYQPIIECFKKNRVYFNKGSYAEELARIKEALGQAARDVPSVKDMQVEAALARCASAFDTTRFTGPPTPAAPDATHCLQTTDDAIDIAPRVITEMMTDCVRESKRGGAGACKPLRAQDT